MKILVLSQFFSTTRGGGEYLFSLIAKKLAENNHQVFVITNKVDGEKYDSQKNLQVVFVPPTLKHDKILPSFSDNITYAINAIIKGLKIIKKEKIDIINSNNFSPALAGSVLSSLTSIPHITTIHDIFSLYGKDFQRQWKKQSDTSKLNVMLTPFFEKLVTNLKHNCVHTVSETTKDDLVKLGEKKPIHVIHNSVDIRKIYEISNPFQLIYVGRLLFYKNLEVAIKAINIAKDSERRIKLVIVGNGPHKKTLEELVQRLELQQQVEFKGYLDEHEKTRLIASSHALVFPSLCEGFGLVILEAFAQERPVLVSNVRPMSDIVIHNITGYVLDPHDEKTWADHFLKIINNKEKTEKMGKAGNELLKSKYNQEIMYQNIMKVYNSVMANYGCRKLS